MDIGSRAMAPDTQNAFVPGMENSRAYGDAASGDVFGLTVASFAAMIETP